FEIGRTCAGARSDVAIARRRQPGDGICLDAFQLTDERVLTNRRHAGAGVRGEYAATAHAIGIRAAGEAVVRIVLGARTDLAAVGTAQASRAWQVGVPQSLEGAEHDRLVGGEDDVEVDLDPALRAGAGDHVHRVEAVARSLARLQRVIAAVVGVHIEAVRR